MTNTWARDARRWFKVAERATEVLYHARGGGKVGWGLAAMGIAGAALEHLTNTARSPSELMEDAGLVSSYGSIGKFLCRLLLDAPGMQRLEQADGTVVFWRNERGVAYAGAIYDGTWLQDGPFLPRDGDHREFEAAVFRTAWAKGAHLLLSSISTEQDWALRTGDEYRLDPLPPPGPFLGRLDPRHYGDRLRRYGPGARAVLIRGPSGVGKSVLAQHIATELAGSDARVLKIPAAASVKASPHELMQLVGYLKPSVLLLDDLEVRHNVEGWLALLEVLRDPNALTIATQMTDATSDGPGDWYLPGMRPGRIDEVFSLTLPDPVERHAILANYLRDLHVEASEAERAAFVAATDGLSGAYLGEFVRRLGAHGRAGWEEELANLRRCAPAPGAPDDAPF